jgi:multicomponent Na+:H+ antiporter subunit B
MSFTPDYLPNVALLLLLIAVAVSAVRARDLLASTILLGVYSFIMAVVYLVLDAPDVSITEAAVGAGVSTVFLLGCLSLVGREEQGPKRVQALPLLAVAMLGGALVYATFDMPMWGSTTSKTQSYLAPYFLQRTEVETGIPNVVTAVLASYRGYDTLGETTVILTAALAAAMLLGRRPGHRRDNLP